MPTLKSRRESHGLTQIEFAKGAKVSVQLIRKIEQTGATPYSPEYRRVIEYIEELDSKRKREERAIREVRMALERDLEELRTQIAPELMPHLSRLESILYTGYESGGKMYPALIEIEGIEEPNPHYKVER